MYFGYDVLMDKARAADDRPADGPQVSWIWVDRQVTGEKPINGRPQRIYSRSWPYLFAAN
jgi:hypothetical protein